ncbi:MAG TPA: porin [Allosphingosinicella sp.]
MKRSGGIAAVAGVAVVAASLMLAPATAQTSRSAPSLRGAPSGSFTPAVADPRLAAALARRANATPRFRFTPAMTTAERRRPVQVAVRARAAAPTTAAAASRVQTASATPITAITPASYNLGASVGWRRFAISGDVAESRDGVVTGRRASAQVGMSYRANQRVTARVQASAEQTEGRQRVVAEDEAYAVDVGGSYSIARNVDVTGGVRYRIARDRLETVATDQRRDSQAVYIGTAFRF